MWSGWRGLFAEKLEASARSRVSQYLSSVERGSRDYDMEKMTCTLWNSERLFSKAEILFLAVKWGAEPENQIKFFYENAIQFWQNPNHEFFTQIFLTIFLVKSRLSTKKSKTTSRVFHPEKSTIFSGNQIWFFGQKMKISNSVCSVLFPCLSSSASVFLRKN